jgi:hypothetical protein
MADQRKKTLSYHRAEFFVDDKGAINLGMCIKQATDKVSVPNRFVQRPDGRTTRLAHFKTDEEKGCFLHLTVDTPGEHTSVVQKTLEDTVEIKVSTIPPPNDAEYMDGDAFLYVRGNNICLCATTVRTTSIAHDSPRLSDRPENVCEERLLVQHAGETLHQRTQPTFRHHGD